jgi:hypothetical protein
LLANLSVSTAPRYSIRIPKSKNRKPLPALLITRIRYRIKFPHQSRVKSRLDPSLKRSAPQTQCSSNEVLLYPFRLLLFPTFCPDREPCAVRLSFISAYRIFSRGIVPSFWDDDGSDFVSPELVEGPLPNSDFASSELVEGRIREAFHPEQYNRIGTISIYGHPIRAGINPAATLR